MDCVKWNFSFVHYGHKSKSGKITQPAAHQSTGDVRPSNMLRSKFVLSRYVLNLVTEINEDETEEQKNIYGLSKPGH